MNPKDMEKTDAPLHKGRGFPSFNTEQSLNHQYLQRRSNTMQSSRAKPAMEIYRPPSVRMGSFEVPNHAHPKFNNMFQAEGPHHHQYHHHHHHHHHQKGFLSKSYSQHDRNGFQLNVHAKEFTMRGGGSGGPGGIQQSRSSGNIAQMIFAQQGMVPPPFAKPNGAPFSGGQRNRAAHPLQQSKSSGNILHQVKQNTSPPRVHFRLEEEEPPDLAPKIFKSQTCLQLSVKGSEQQQEQRQHQQQHQATEVNGRPCDASCSSSSSPGGGLKRSKSLGAGDMYSSGRLPSPEVPELGTFPPEVQLTIRKALEDPNQLPARSLMELVRRLFDRLVEGTRYAEPAAKLCITIIEREKQETFLESLLNTCQEWFQERERLLRPPGNSSANTSLAASHSPRWVAYMTFLNEMYCQLKRRQLQLQTQWEGVSPGMLLLTLICECCLVCLRPPLRNSLNETECLFFAVTAVGRDLEQEAPLRLNQLFDAARDAFLFPGSSTPFKKTLLQLIELHAARWQLPAPALLYYYPASSK